MTNDDRGDVQLLAMPAERAARAVALALLDRASSAYDRLDLAGDARGEGDAETAREPGDRGAVHAFRVALRRLRSWLRAYRAALHGSVRGKARRRLRQLQSATGASRDAEVQIAWVREQRRALTGGQRVGATWLLARLEPRRREADRAMRRAARRRFPELRTRLDDALAMPRPHRAPGAGPDAGDSFAAAAAPVAAEHARALARCLDAVRDAGDDAARDLALHEARLATKRLRYVVEPLANEELPAAAQLVDRLRALQDALGELHDATLLAGVLLDAIAEAGAATARALGELALAGKPTTRVLRQERVRNPRPGLLALAQRLHARLEKARDDAAPAWSEGSVAVLRDEGEALVRALEDGAAPERGARD